MNVSRKIAVLLVIFLFTLIGIAHQGYAATWGDVLNDYNMYTSQYPIDTIWFKKLSGCNFEMWRRPGNYLISSSISDCIRFHCYSWYICIEKATYRSDTYCDGSNSGTSMWYGSDYCQFYVEPPVDGECPETYLGLSVGCIPSEITYTVNCGFTDVKLGTYTITRANCVYQNLIGNVFGDNNEYALNMPINKNCQDCIPLGMEFDGSDQGYVMLDQNTEIDDPNHQVCFYYSHMIDPVDQFTGNIPQSSYGADLSLSSNSTGTLLTQPAICDGGGQDTFTIGHEPYDNTPIVSSFITNTETSCKIDAISVATGANTNVTWTIIMPTDWIAQGQQNTLNYSQVATVPKHPVGGRPADMQIQLKATYTKDGNTVETTLTETQSPTDRIRQMYIDHNIKIPNRGEFVGGTEIAVKDEVFQARNDALADFRNWCDDQTIGLWGRTSGYRNPETNELYSKSTNPSVWQSIHQYGWAEDFGPITTDCSGTGSQDDAAYIRDYLISNGAVYSYIFQGQTSGWWHIHHHYTSYNDLPNIVNP